MAQKADYFQKKNGSFSIVSPEGGFYRARDCRLRFRPYFIVSLGITDKKALLSLIREKNEKKGPKNSIF
jgi:hypothetical protein